MLHEREGLGQPGLHVSAEEDVAGGVEPGGFGRAVVGVRRVIGCGGWCGAARGERDRKEGRAGSCFLKGFPDGCGLEWFAPVFAASGQLVRPCGPVADDEDLPGGLVDCYGPAGEVEGRGGEDGWGDGGFG